MDERRIHALTQRTVETLDSMTEQIQTRPANYRKIGWALAFLSTFCFSVAPPFSRGLILAGLNPTQVLVLRMAITTLLLVATVIVTKPSLLRADAHSRKWSLIAGAVGSLGMMGYFWGLTRLDASIASMIMAAAPLVVLALLALRGEPITARNLVRMGLALAGIYLLIGPGGNVDIVGVLLVSVTIFTYSAQYVIMQWRLGGYDARSVTLYSMIGMTISLFLFWIIQGRPWQNPTSTEWLIILVLAVVSTYGARLSLFAAIARIGSAQVSMLTPVETLLTIFWSMLFLDERLTAVQWLGGLLVLSSALLAFDQIKRVRLPIRWRA
jgi:drug/metabolite transporter (DMT)-like permease